MISNRPLQILSLESKLSDIQGVICETTKFAIEASKAGNQSDNFCFFSEQTFYGFMGLNNTRPFQLNDGSTNEIKCSEVIKSGFSEAISIRLIQLCRNIICFELIVCIRESCQKCPGQFDMIFIWLEDLFFEEFDDSTYFTVTGIDMMNQPEETIRFDKSTIMSDFINENSRWIQAKNQTIRIQNNVTLSSSEF